ncbi:hypothetical protein VUR80DRAFT_8061 [Thermomyces stellatus]
MDDLFDDALSLEETLYKEGYDRGTADGARAGRLEGRSVGMGKGFEKFVESGRLYGRSVVWANRLPSTAPSQGLASTGAAELPRLPQNARLAKNVETVHALMEPGTLSTENSDEAVQDFDERLRRAQGKARIIERAIAGRASKDEGKASKDEGKASGEEN